MRLFLCGDVMTGRGIDQALPHSVDPVLHEPFVCDAREYVDLAEKANGPILRPLSFDYIWGDALPELERFGTDLRIINLETPMTSTETHWPDKEIHYARWRTTTCWTGDMKDCPRRCALWMRRTFAARARGRMPRRQQLPRLSTYRTKAAHFSSHLDRQPAVFRRAGAPLAFLRE